ncbi:MAG: toll/interleukin-1 receptor domain-containing protein [Pseudomonadota bacterium]|nr:toll/interleukin-1 receptor domain-containing protein [Pseudomonadota bacterium]
MLPMQDVFISYRRDHGAALARVIAQAIEKAGFSVFLDVDDINGRQFDRVLRDTIEGAAHFVLLLTVGSLERLSEPGDWVAQEIATAVAAGSHIVIMREGDTIDPSRVELPPSLASIASLDAILYTHYNALDALAKLVGRLLNDAASLPQVANTELSAMDATLLQGDYQAWQDRTLYALYGSDIERAALPPGHAYFPSVNGKRYAIACYPGALDGAQFTHQRLGKPQVTMREVDLLPDLTLDKRAPVPAWVRRMPGGAMRQRYFELLSHGKRVRRWNMRGFALSHLEFDADHRVCGYGATLCTYGENCLSSHLLAYDLYRCHEDSASPLHRPAFSIADARPDDPAFFPLISVQAIILFKEDPEDADSWTLIAMERGAGVAAAAGFWQFPPAGGFEIYGKEDDGPDHVLAQFDMRLALIREFLEEIYGDTEMACEFPGSSSADHTGSDGYQFVLDSLAEQGMHIHFLGVVTELVSLRSEFSFAIVIDRIRDFSKLKYLVEPGNAQARWLKGSSESKRLNKFPVADIARHFQPDKVWNPSSVGMLRLLADCSADQEGWLRRAYPDFPTIELPE